ncbi:unnamed protein product [Urochloa decumbens]|uniref:KIB1-4 beta-propeller domain-containing protein n=1 Tax=Urochloa decumbens TaxID=240449 RepID=A0ABC8W6Q1_9POAL
MPATTAAATSPPWADLPPELLANIMARLHVVSDFVRFHAVCYDWNIAGHGYDPPSSLLPWLVAPSSAVFFDVAEEQLCRCIFSKATYRAPGICAGDRRVACADGTAAWLVRGKDGETFLANPLSGDKLSFPDECMSADEWLDHRYNRSISGDGTALLYRFNPKPLDGRFRASFRHPYGEKWKSLWSSLGGSDRCCAAAYHRGHVVCVDLVNCHVLWPAWDCQPITAYGQLWLENTREVRAVLPEEPGKARRCSYLVEFDGGLLLASVLREAGSGNGDELSVSLHELRLNGSDDQPEVVWVRRDESDSDIGKLNDHVMFLGFPGSFAVEAAEFGGEVSGGAAYFVIERNSPAAEEPCSVYRYAFHDGVAALVETLPPGWSDPTCMWFLPDPTILGLIGPPKDKEDSVPTATSGDVQGCGNKGGPPPADHSRICDLFAKLLFQSADPIMPAATTTDTAGGGFQWSELPADLLRDISVRLHAAADFVRFRAVCRPWAESTLVDGPPPSFLPWLLAPSAADVAAVGLADQRCRCVFSKTSCRAPGICIRDRRVACADGTAAWLVGGSLEPGLVNPLTAAVLPFPPIGRTSRPMPDRAHRIVSGDGAVLVYDFTPHPPGKLVGYFRHDDFKGAILCPDHEPWLDVSGDLAADRCCAAVFSRGDVVCSDLPGKVRRCSYLLEPRGGGELLLASVLQEACGPLAGDLSVSLHALDRRTGGEEPVVEWSRRDEDMRMLGDDVLFLGFPGSFAVDAARFGRDVSGGTAYFVVDSSVRYGWSSCTRLPAAEPCHVYRYSFHDGTTELVETLPPEWNDPRCMWFLPDPAQISPIRARRDPATSSGSSGGRESGDHEGSGL